MANDMPICEWTVDEDGIYDTTCGHKFIFTDDGPVENKLVYCGYCGRILKAEPVRTQSTMRTKGE